MKKIINVVFKIILTWLFVTVATSVTLGLIYILLSTQWGRENPVLVLLMMSATLFAAAFTSNKKGDK